MADKTTGALAAVAEAPIGSLPGIADLYDDTLLPVEQQGEARHMTGRAGLRRGCEAVRRGGGKQRGCSSQERPGSCWQRVRRGRQRPDRPAVQRQAARHH